MNEEQEASTEQKAAAKGPRGGERLAEARREQQISVLEIAKELHLDEPKVRALENNDFEVLGAPVFAKGHLRKYAQLVGVDHADVFADYYAMTRATAAQPVVVGRKRIREEVSPGPWIALVVILLVAAGGYWWFFMREGGQSLLSAVPANSAPDMAPPGSIAAQGPLQQAESEPFVSAPLQQAESEQIVATPPEAANVVPQVSRSEEPLPPGQLRLAVTFSGDCWTEISDADGRQLYVNMGHSGQSLDLRGKAPITALFGNADNVSLRVNDEQYALPTPTSATRMVRVAITSR